jgi:fumarate hydratase subunit alpha
MKTILYKSIVAAVRQLCITAAFDLPPDVSRALKKTLKIETSPLALSLLSRCVDNAHTAKQEHIPVCQDTGIAVYFVELGADVRIKGGLLTDAINEGTRLGYRDAYLRPSMVNDPVYGRKNTFTNTPAVIHCEPVSGESLSITLAPKGGGSENMSVLSMLKPAEGESGVIRVVTDAVVTAGGNPCPPIIVGIGIGGTAEKALLLSKKALLRPVGRAHKQKKFADLEKTILDNVNKSGIGAGGLGGIVTALAVHIETFPCHIATLPVAVSLSCHVARHASVVL